MKIDFKAYLQKLQNLPEDKKKIVLWVIVAVLAVVMGLFWAVGAINSLSKIGESAGNIELPEFDNILQNTTPSN